MVSVCLKKMGGIYPSWDVHKIRFFREMPRTEGLVLLLTDHLSVILIWKHCTVDTGLRLLMGPLLCRSCHVYRGEVTLTKLPRKMPHNKGNNFESTPSIINWDIWQIVFPSGLCKFVSFLKRKWLLSALNNQVSTSTELSLK